MKKENKTNCKICQFEKKHSLECPLYEVPTPYGQCTCGDLLKTDEERSAGKCDNCNE